MVKKILAAGVGLIVFLIFWFVGLAILVAINFPIVLGLLLWSFLAAKMFGFIYDKLD